MKNGFTMIELIFIIVILGILAAVAIPKLAEKKELEATKSAPTVVVPATEDDSPFPITIYTAPTK